MAELLNWLVTTMRPATMLGVNSHATFPSSQRLIRYGCQTNPDGKVHPLHIRAAFFKHYI